MSNYKSYFLKSMGLREDSLPGGKGDETQPSQVDPQQLEMGIKVEMEHTQDEALAKEIALDHLTEDPNYYSTLKGAGLADELPGSSNGETLPMPPQMSKLMGPQLSPTAKFPQVIAVGIRGTRSGGLPAGGHVTDPEKARLGGWEEMKVLPQGGVKGDPEKARLGGWERVKNLKPNSQGAISDTPASDAIKAKGGHFTPDNGEITRGEAPKTNKKGSDAIHPMQVQQLGNEPIDDDGTTRDGKETPASAEAGIEGGSAPTSEPDEHPMSSMVAGKEQDAPNPPGDNFAAPEEKEEKPKGPWGIGLDNEDEDEDEKEEGEADGVSIDIKETLADAKQTLVKDGIDPVLAVGLGTAAGTMAYRAGKDLYKHFKNKKSKPNSSLDVKPESPIKVKECDDCGCGDPTMVHRFQQLANIKGKDGKMGEAGLTSEAEEDFGISTGSPNRQCLKCKSVVAKKDFYGENGCIKCNPTASKLKELKELVGRLNAKGKVTPLLAKAQKYLKEMDSPEEPGTGKLDSFIQDAIAHRNQTDDQNDVAEKIVTKLEDLGAKNIQRRYDYILSMVTKYWK